MKSISKIIIVSLWSFGLWSCNQDLRFSSLDKIAGTEPSPISPTPPIEPGITPPPLPLPPPEVIKEINTKLQGNCASDSSSSLTQCLKCQIPPPPAQQPQLSYKGQALLEIMSQACQILNKSDPKNYIAPDREMIRDRINRCSPRLYKDTPASTKQQELIQNLVGTSEALRKKMFGKLWYNPPYSDYFETFFGLDIREVRDLLCYQGGGINGALYDIGYYNSEDTFNYKMPKEYVVANQIRDDLKNCLHQSAINPWTPSPEPAPRKCHFEKMTGKPGPDMKDQVQEWLDRGWIVGAEAPSQGLCLSVKTGQELNEIKSQFTAAAYICE